MLPIVVNDLGPSLSAATTFLKGITPPPSKTPPRETPLLKQVRISLRGPDAEDTTIIHTHTEDSGERELTWSGSTAVLTQGGVIMKKWCFDAEEETIQWACLGRLEQTVMEDVITRTAANYITPEDPPPPPVTNGRPIFGPFARPNIGPKADKGKSVIEPAVFIFLRSTAKIYLSNGLDYTFSLPFVVRRAWPISPHGIMVQRVLDQYEIFEAGVNGDVPLPTIFSVTSPFSEAAVVGLTSGILGETRDLPPALKDADEHANKPLKSIPPTDMIVWASRPSASGDSHNIVTVDVEKGQLSIWQYVHIKPKDTPTPIDSTQSEVRNAHKKRQSLSNRRTSAMFEGTSDPRHRMLAMSPLLGSQDLASTQIPDFPDPSDVVPLSSLPGMPPALSTTTTMASLVSGIMSSQPSYPKKGRRSSLVKNDLSMTMDRMALGGRLDSDAAITPADQGKMTAAFWMTTLTTQSIEQEDAQSWQDIAVSFFDDRWDGQQRRCLLSISLPMSRRILIFSLAQQEDRITHVNLVTELPGLCATSLRATRANVWDLLVVKHPGDLVVLTHGLAEIPVVLRDPEEQKDIHTNTLPTAPRMHTGGLIIKVRNLRHGTVLLTRDDGSETRAAFDIFPQDALTNQCLQVLALILPAAEAFEVHSQFLANWSAKNWSTAQNVEFGCLASALYTIFQLQNEEVSVTPDPWLRLGQSDSHSRLCEDPALRGLRTPPTALPPRPILSVLVAHPLLGPVVQGLHIMGESLRLLLHRHSDVLRFAPVICRLAMGVRPEWADYWKRLVPDAMAAWPTPATLNFETFEDRMPVWPADIASILHARLNNPDWKVPWHDMQHIVTRFDITPSLHYGLCDPLQELHELSLLYNTLSDRSIPDGQNRAENTILKMVTQNTSNLLPLLPLGMAAPLREAARSCQLSPPGNWPLEAYVAIGRNDLAASANQNPDLVFSDGYNSKKDLVDKPRQTISQISLEARGQAGGEIDAVSGVELEQKEFTDIRFGQDRRLEEVARLLCSSTSPSVKSMDRPELSEHDQTKEHQNQVVRVAERTFALPYGRAMFTYGSVPTIAREAYLVPKIEYTVRVQPLNILVTPEPGKISPESICWGEFHNGVAAALRIAPGATGVESSWIAFNKPSDLSPEHAGFLLGLGLNGHLKEMLTWHTFSYLTPKHDLTSIGVLLGLSTANMGTANSHVTKLLAVHTPALLPTPSVDLNVSLLTQAAGLSGIGILYLGTKNRRMGEVCLSQISRKDLVQPDLSNEYREAYTYSTALAFGMIMLGKGSNIPADMLIVKRLHSLIHGGVNRMLGYGAKPAFDVNLTSPAASIGLGLMYLRTNRRDIADILTIPETVLELNSIQPTFLLVRTIARSLILWDQIKPSSEWMTAQVPGAIQRAVELRTKTGKRVDDAIDLAYYNILAGGCFAIGLKFAGTARQEAYQAIVRTYDLFSRLAHATGPAFDVKIRRSAIRDGLNLISIALSMVMAGTGEVTCLRRLRYSYGMYQQMMYHQGFKYGVHAATHMAMGLLFLGGGRYTLGTSDAAIACMVTAFFPRFNHVSSDNKSYLQALRHLWVLAVEPRCLIARDVDTKEVVYLPVKITMKGEPETAPGALNPSAQLISPTLIPDIDNLKSIRVDTPRYWPFYLDTVTHARHKEALLKSQTLYVKRRTAFLSYTEDPRGSRSLFVRSGASSFGDAAMLDFPQVPNTKIHPAGDMSEFITSFSNNILFLAFADHLARPSRSRSQGRRGGEEDVPPEERIFHAYCHAALLDSIIQDKPETLQSHLTLYQYRKMDPRSRYFHLRMQDLRFAADFYAGKVYEKRFGGTSPTNARSGLLRETTVLGVLHTLDRKFEEIKAQFGVLGYVGRYARGEILPGLPAPLPVKDTNIDPGSGSGGGGFDEGLMTKFLAWYLLRNGVPSSTILVVMRSLARDAHNQCLGRTPPDGTPDEYLLDTGIREVLHTTGNRMTSTHAIPWTVRSLDEIIDAWKGS